MSRDNWERLVAAVMKREQLWQLCHGHSKSPSISTISSDITSDFSEQILNFSSNSLEPISVSPPPPVPLKKPSVSQEDLRVHLGQVRRFSLHELRVATEYFSYKNLFRYGYNKVYKGWLADGSAVAVKRYIDRGASQTAKVQFQKEIEISSIAAHANVLNVLGFCITPKQWLLVYRLMVNGSVASCLRGRHESRPPLNWPIRKGLALGSARGLAYLHYECDKKIITSKLQIYCGTRTLKQLLLTSSWPKSWTAMRFMLPQM